MTNKNNVTSPTWLGTGAPETFEAMGAAERRLWSSFVRQAEIDRTVAVIQEPATCGVVVLGPWGVGKTTLARAVETALAGTTHIERIFGSSSDTLVAYGPLSMQMARLPATALVSPASILRGIDELIRADAAGRKVLLVVDDLPGLDIMTIGVIMNLALGRTVKLLVLARDTDGLPEDFVWMAKDGMLGEIRLDYFTRAEVGELITMATGTFVSESAVTVLHEASNGIPLVLQVLFREQVAKGNIIKRLGGWVVEAPINMDVSSTLAETVRSRLAREDSAVRVGVEKMSLLGQAPLQVAASVLGQDMLWRLEQRGFVEVDNGLRHRVSFAERYVGDIVRSALSAARKAELFRDISQTFDQSLGTADHRESLAMAAWMLDAGIVPDPGFALRVAKNALRDFDPALVLRLADEVPAGHRLSIQAVQARSAAHCLLADYSAAVEELDRVPEQTISDLSAGDFAAWTLSSTRALLWLPDTDRRIVDLLAAANDRLAVPGDTAQVDAVDKARRQIDLARFEYMVHRGQFSAVINELETAANHPDSEFSLNCACLLVLALAVVGREMEAIELGQRIQEQVAGNGRLPLYFDYCRNGLADAQIWSGQWLDCVEMLLSDLEGIPQPVTYRGGLIELNLGLAHAYAGRGSNAVQVLLSAAAQLEARNSDNALGLAYSALAFCHAQADNEPEALAYLTRSDSLQGTTLWTNQAMGEFFRLMTLRWLDDPHAAEQLRRSALQDMAVGRYATASMSLFGGSVQATDQEFLLLEEASLRRQGPMAGINVLVARASRFHNAHQAFEAADRAKELRLDAVESRCVVLALDFARESGKNDLARRATQRLERLNRKLAKLPLEPRSLGAKLTQREIQVAKLAKRGLGNRVIADRIGVSVRTVEGHLYQLYSKLGIASRHELIEDSEI